MDVLGKDDPYIHVVPPKFARCQGTVGQSPSHPLGMLHCHMYDSATLPCIESRLLLTASLLREQQNWPLRMCALSLSMATWQLPTPKVLLTATDGRAVLRQMS